MKKHTLAFYGILMISFQTLLAQTPTVSRPAIFHQFSPGDIWPDDHGVHINAHGGGILFDHGVYYWFGEHKIAGSAGNTAHIGVHVYSSTDLYNWKDAGIALPVSSDPKNDLADGCILERPKVIKCAKTGKYVMWFHLETKGHGYDSARAGVAVADHPAGPYIYLNSFRLNAGTWPENATPEMKNIPAPGSSSKPTWLQRDFSGGQMSRDMTLFVDDDGFAYHITSSEDNNTLLISRLNDDYTKCSGRYVEALPKGLNEAPALFKHHGKYYLLTSGCSSWAPNSARLAVADSIWGPYTRIGNPCQGVNPDNKLGPEKTFGGQSTYVLPLAGQPDCLIAMFDIWKPNDAIDGRYVWLPVQFQDEKPIIRWIKPWDLSVFGIK
jgi:hypothetical protein